MGLQWAALWVYVGGDVFILQPRWVREGINVIDEYQVEFCGLYSTSC